MLSWRQAKRGGERERCGGHPRGFGGTPWAEAKLLLSPGASRTFQRPGLPAVREIKTLTASSWKRPTNRSSISSPTCSPVTIIKGQESPVSISWGGETERTWRSGWVVLCFLSAEGWGHKALRKQRRLTTCHPFSSQRVLCFLSLKGRVLMTRRNRGLGKRREWRMTCHYIILIII